MRVHMRFAFCIVSMILTIALFQNCGAPFESLKGVSTPLASSRIDGASLYTNNCASCHGVLLSSTKKGRSAEQISSAIANQPNMQNLSHLNRDEIQAIADALNLAVGTQKFTCTNPELRGASQTDLRRLKDQEYKNTIADLFGEDVVTQVANLSTLPADNFDEQVGEFNSTYFDQGVQAVANISIEIANLVSDSPSFLARVAPDCIVQQSEANISQDCLRSFVTSFGKRVLRRPLTNSRIDQYIAEYDGARTSGFATKQSLALLIGQILMAPEAVYHWEVLEPDTVAGPRQAVDQYTIASRLAYRLTETAPDDELLAAADRGELKDPVKLQLQAERILGSIRGRQKVRGMAMHWLRLEKAPVPTPVSMQSAGFTSIDDTLRASLRDSLIVETLDYVEYIVFDLNGNFSDLMSSELIFPKTPAVAQVFGSRVSDTTPLMDSNGRQGLMMRPAVLLSSGDRVSHIGRGVSMRLRMLCDEVPPLPVNLDAEVAARSDEIDPFASSSRDQTAQLTETSSCRGCHARLNSLGYALNSFGPLGQFRTIESLFNDQGQEMAQFPIDSSATDLDVISPQDQVDGHQGLPNLFSQSAKAQACFATYAFRYSRTQMDAEADHCQLAETEQVIKSNLSLKQALIINATGEDIYWKGGAQ